ncbi:MAG: DUF4097 domain-containing protein, partial [Gemmatimonadales bacterium]
MVSGAIKLAVVAVAAAWITPTDLRVQDERFELAGDRVAVYNLAGTVTIITGTGSSVVVEVSPMGADADDLTFLTGDACGANALRIIYPDDDIVYTDQTGNTQLNVREDGTFYGHRNWHRREDWGCHRDGDWDDWDDRIRIRSRGRGAEVHADLTIAVPAGKILEIYLGAGTVEASNVSGTLIVDVGAAEVATRNTDGRLFIDTGSGDVTVADVTGEVIVDTGSGNVDVDRMSGPFLIVDTGSGGVGGGHITVDELNVDTGSGSVRLDAVSAPDVIVDTGSGSVELDLLADVESLSVDTGSGSVDVMVPSTLDARVEIDTGSGGIDVDFPISVRRWERNHVEGVIGQGLGRGFIDTG